MKPSKTFSGLMLIVAAACIGFALIFLPGWIIDNYKTINAFGAWAGITYLVLVGIGAFLLIGSTIWTIWKLWGASIAKNRKRERRNKNPSELSNSQKDFEIDENLKQVDQLREQAGNDPELANQLDPLLKEIEYKRESLELEIVAFGTISSGKSSVLNLLAGNDSFKTDIRGGTTVTRNEIPWPTNDKVTLVDTPGIGEVDGEDHVSIAAESAKDADLVLVVVDGPLRQSEHDLLDQLGKMEKRVIICLNKSDWYAEDDREKLKGQIRRQTASFVEDEDVVSIQAQVGERIRRRVLPDGSTTEETVEVPADIEPLATRMVDIVRKDGKELLMANVLLQSRGLVEKARDKVQRQVDEKAWDIVDKYMWGAGGVAALSPFPMVDLIAGSAISTKMILDLADVYNQKVDLEMARSWLAEMGKNLVGFLGAQGAAVAITAVTSSLVKTIPFAGTFAGGVLQGAVQALITKWIGSVFIEYFRDEMRTPEGGFAGLARRHWEKVMAVDELRKLVQTARSKLSDED
jgi:small GTP-binding protein